jgi:hypothetical protein
LFILYSISFTIIGSIIGYLGVEAITSTAEISPDPYKLGIGIIALLFSLILILFGNIASFFKINSDVIGDEISERLSAEGSATEKKFVA